MIARCYKIMNNLAYNPDSHIEKPLINACYFGAFHMENIKDFLTKGGSNGDYNLIVDINDDTNITDTHDKIRCLKIEKNLDMDDMINRLITRREEHEKKLSKEAKEKKYKVLAKIKADPIKAKKI
jgi:hypothetical protein